MRKTKKQQGYIILILAIIVTSIGALVAANNLTISTDNLRLTGGNQDSAEAFNLSASCVEVALSKFRENRNYPGNEEIIIDSGEDATEGTADDVTCQILTVAPGQNGQRIFHAIYSDETFTKYREVSLRSTDPTLVIEYDREIPSLVGTANEFHPFVTGSYENMLMWISARAFANNGNQATSVNSIPDLGPNGVNIDQSTPSSRPTYRENGPANIPTFYFDGVDDWLGTDLDLPETNYSAVVVYASDDTSGNFISAVDTLSPTAVNADRQFGLQSGNLQQRVFNLETINSTSTYNDNNLYIALSTLGDSGQYIHVDGVQVAAGIKQSSDSTTDTATIIGAHSTWGFLDGDISELIIFDSELNPQERSELFAYLGRIYGVTIN
jgi:hypothetical protein